MSDYKSLNEEQRKVWNAVLTRILISEGKVIDVALKAGETLADVTSIHPAIPIPTP